MLNMEPTHTNHAIDFEKLSLSLEKPVSDCSKLILERFKEQSKTVQKKEIDNSVVTETDIEIEKILSLCLPRIIPGSTFIGEESAPTSIDSANKIFNASYIWVVDPIDGTLNFVNNLPIFALSIGLLKKTDKGLLPVFGLAAFPALNEIVVGYEKNIRVYDINFNLTQNIVTNYPNNTDKGIILVGDGCPEDLIKTKDSITRRIGSTVADIVYTALNRSVATLSIWHLWDIAGGSAIILASGKKIFISGQETNLYNISNFTVENSKNNWNLKQPAIFCSDEYFNYLKSKK